MLLLLLREFFGAVKISTKKKKNDKFTDFYNIQEYQKVVHTVYCIRICTEKRLESLIVSRIPHALTRTTWSTRYCMSICVISPGFEHHFGLRTYTSVAYEDRHYILHFLRNRVN